MANAVISLVVLTSKTRGRTDSSDPADGFRVISGSRAPSREQSVESGASVRPFRLRGLIDFDGGTLLRPERHRRINTRRPTRRDAGSQQRHHQKDQRNRTEHHRVGRAHVVELRA
jgi:hypothetical protein